MTYKRSPFSIFSNVLNGLFVPGSSNTVTESVLFDSIDCAGRHVSSHFYESAIVIPRLYTSAVFIQSNISGPGYPSQSDPSIVTGASGPARRSAAGRGARSIRVLSNATCVSIRPRGSVFSSATIDRPNRSRQITRDAYLPLLLPTLSVNLDRSSD